jgi:hypothetical protein
MDSVGTECHRGHIQGLVAAEDREPGQADEQVHTNEELAETRHPYAPHAVGPIHPGISLGESEQLLRTIDQVTGTQPEEAEDHRDKR